MSRLSYFTLVAGIISINGSLLSVSNDLSIQQIQVNCYTYEIEPDEVTWRIGSELIDSSYQPVNESEWMDEPVNGSHSLDSANQSYYRHYITLSGSFSVGMSISCNTSVNGTTSSLTYQLQGQWTITNTIINQSFIFTSSTFTSSQWFISYHIVQ